MAFDINYIENYGSSNNVISWGTLIGTAFGFGLAQTANLLNNYIKKRKVGRIFNLELKGSRSNFDTQIDSIIDVKNKLKNNEPSSVGLYLKQKFNTIKSLDKLTIIDYFDNWWDKKFNNGKKNKPSYWVTDTLGIIENIGLEMIRLEKWDDEFKIELGVLTIDYAKELNIILEKHATKADGLEPDVIMKDPVLGKFHVLFQKSFLTAEYEFIPITLANLQERIRFFHGPLSNDFPRDETNVLSMQTIEFNTKTRGIIEQLNYKRDGYIQSLELIEKTLKYNYEKLYNEPYKPTQK